MLKILSDADKEKIHRTGLSILSEIGVEINHRETYNRLLDAGAEPDKNDKSRVFLPETLVVQSLRFCPKEFSIRNRKGEDTVVIAGGRTLYYTANGIQYVRGTGRTAIDIGVNEYSDFVKVVNKLENIDGIVGTSLKEFPPACRDFAGFKIAAQLSYKHLRPCIYTPSGAEAIIEMADVILEGKSLKENMFFTLGYSIISPLTWSQSALELFTKTSGFGIPLMINSEPLAGGTSPVTLAGSLAMADAEILSGIVINQILEPGRPCIYNAGFAHVFDMLTTIALTGSPENALLQAAGAEMAQYHGLPSASWSLSDSAMLDSQASYEKMLELLVHSMSKVNVVWGMGNIETSRAISPEVAVIDNELAGICKRFSSGITVEENTLAFDIMKEVIFKSSFLESMHTLENFQKEIRYSHLPNRTTRSAWQSKGSMSIEEKAEKYTREVLNSRPDFYLSGKQIEKLEVIQQKWMNRLGK